MDLLTPKELAKVLDTTEQALAAHRHKGTGPNFVKLGRRVYYRPTDIEKWIDSNVRTRTDLRIGA